MKIKKEWKIIIVLLVILITILCLIFFKTDIFKKKDALVINKTPEQIISDKGIKLVSKENFVSEVNTLLEKGYTADEINQIYEYMSSKNITAILTNDYVDLSEFYQIRNFDFLKINRYKAYQTLENIPMKDAVTRVNLNLDLPFYSTITEIENPDSLTVTVSKYRHLPSTYVPEDLENIPGYNLKLRKVAMDDYLKLIAASKLDGLYLIPYSTYRSYDYQVKLYNYYLQRDPQSVVDTYSARPGHSEHQTGLTIDIRSSSSFDNLTDKDYEWMLNNSYKYGFIIRYPKNSQNITGYMEEPWHIRYVGLEAATKIHEENISLDEYNDLYLTEY